MSTPQRACAEGAHHRRRWYLSATGEPPHPRSPQRGHSLTSGQASDRLAAAWVDHPPAFQAQGAWAEARECWLGLRACWRELGTHLCALAACRVSRRRSIRRSNDPAELRRDASCGSTRSKWPLHEPGAPQVVERVGTVAVEREQCGCACAAAHGHFRQVH